MAKRRKKKGPKRSAKKRAKKGPRSAAKKLKRNQCKDCRRVCKSPSGLASHRRSAHPTGPDNPTPKKGLFLKSMCETGNVTIAAEAAGVCRQMPYEWAETDEEFVKAWAEANEHASDLLEEEARRRGKVGVLKPIFQGGKRVGFVRQYSDGLLKFLITARRPEKYRLNISNEHTGKGGGPIQTEPVATKEDLSPKELEKLRKIAGETGVS